MAGCGPANPAGPAGPDTTARTRTASRTTLASVACRTALATSAAAATVASRTAVAAATAAASGAAEAAAPAVGADRGPAGLARLARSNKSVYLRRIIGKYKSIVMQSVYMCYSEGTCILYRSNPNVSNPAYKFNNITTQVICHGDPAVIKEGHKSFPSGHSSWSFAGLGFLSWYLAGKIKAFNRRGHVAKNCIVLLPLLLAAMVAFSRVSDYWHHWQDVFAGGILGRLPVSVGSPTL
ncbi:hypothetical protein C2845_PM05G30430 [Panicum miliaceum]|uniref:Phosphatidic acid phosphatase type 2/haloperoxidase domain-containing protein n=1 Tax=Panicum miliaceum TaxID=4540 RepID=A0A3L6SWF0_PANMI|nr:hypothetical protein C2845_PM05G30430 [Panicum miliaceum]